MRHFDLRSAIVDEPALKICPLLAAREETDCAIELTGSLVDVATELVDFERPAEANKTYWLLKAQREAGVGHAPARPGDGRAAA